MAAALLPDPLWDLVEPFLPIPPRPTNEDIGLDEVAGGIWNIVYYRTLLGKIDVRSLLITAV
jgi:hypothetical protein